MPICRSCESAILWASTESGKHMPLDYKPTDTGIFVFINGKTRKATDADRRLLRPLYTSHFATCPTDQHRKPRGGTPA